MLSNYWLNVYNFHENRQKLGKLFCGIEQKFKVFQEGFLGPKPSVLTKFCLGSTCLGPKSFALCKYRSYLAQSTIKLFAVVQYDVVQ